MDYTQLIPRHTTDARVEEISRDSTHYLLSIPAGKADGYRLAQLDDYTHLNRGRFPLRFPAGLSLTARTSSSSIPGTWGFGLWNDPFGMSLGFGGSAFRLPALPNAVWFFGASEESYLSFRGIGAERSDENIPRSAVEARATCVNRASTVPPKGSGSAQSDEAANGFLAQSFRAPKFHPWLVPAGMALPFSRRTTRSLLGRVIEDEGVRLSADVTEWHRYRLDWRETRVSFEVDDVLVFESHVSPHPPLGTVIWIDNQYAAFTPEGRIGFGVLENPEPAWLEVKDIEIK